MLVKFQDILKSHKNSIVTTYFTLCSYSSLLIKKMVPTWTKTLGYQNWGIEDLPMLQFTLPNTKIGAQKFCILHYLHYHPQTQLIHTRNFIHSVLEKCSQWATPNLWTKSNITTSFHPTKWYLVFSTFHPLLRTSLALNPPSNTLGPFFSLHFLHTTSISTQRIGRKFIS